MSGPVASRAEAGLDRAELERLYDQYRRRQARRLLDILPREAVRPLHRAATAHSDRPGQEVDPLERLVTFCAQLLPLPPFDVWASDLARYPDAHLRDWDDSSEVPTPEEPATLAVRPLSRGSELWHVRLRGYAQDGGWRARLDFQGPALADHHDTAPVFHEATASALRDRFRGFEDGVLEGFLRSCLP